jgi:hypothetical protein
MAIARHPVLSSVSHGRHLPPSWTTLYQLSLIDAPTLSRLIEQSEVNPRTERSDAERMRRLTPASTSLAVISHSGDVERLMAALRGAVTKFINAMNDRLASGPPMTEDELDLVISTINEQLEQMNEFCLDMERRIHIEPMRTVNEPMWENNE